MKTMKWLLRREFWEHKGGMFWAPVVVAAILLVAMTGSVIYGLAAHGIHAQAGGVVVHNGAAFQALPVETRGEVVSVVASSYLLVATPLFIMLGFIAFFYCLGALYDERRDRSILFWKSLPASDSETVLSKVLTAACVIPLITVAAASALGFSFVLITSTALAAKGVNVLGALLASPQLYLAPLTLLSLLPVYVLWALPTVGWLLLVSSWARSKVFLWAVGVPLLTLVAAKWIDGLQRYFFDGGMNLTWLARDVVARFLGGLIPGIWFPFQEVDPTTLMRHGHAGVDLVGVVTQSYGTLVSLDVWIGVAAGAAMIYGAIRMRRYRDEG